MKKRSKLLPLLLVLILLALVYNYVLAPAESGQPALSPIAETVTQAVEETIAQELQTPQEETLSASLDEDGSYTTAEDVCAYLLQYGHLPSNFITKKQAQALGWEGGSLEKAIAPKDWARHNVSDGYWSSEQNIYSFLSYQDRKGRLYTAEECRQELAEYKKSARFARKPRTAPEGFSLKLSLIPVRLLRVRFYARKALRSLLRRLGVIRQAG